MSALYTDEKINLAQCGRQTAKATKAHFGKSYGPLPDSGLVGIRGHYYFLIDQPNGQWLDVTDPPAFFDQPEPAQRLTVTLADVTRYQLSIPKFQSTWKPGGPFRVRLVVTDASGRTHPVVNAPLVATCGDWRAALTTTWTPLNEPTGWMSGTLPATLPQELAVTGSVTVATPTGLQQREVSARFPRGAGLVEADELQIAAQGYLLPRNAAGVVRETRGIWVSTSDIATAIGVSQGAVFKHFPTKDAILQAVMEWVAERLLSRLDKAARSGEPDAVREALAVLVPSYCTPETLVRQPALAGHGARGAAPRWRDVSVRSGVQPY